MAKSIMYKGRLEAFSDGVLAILLTVMVLELHPPPTDQLSSFIRTLPTFFLYGLSFLYLAIYWVNHHHMLHTCRSVTGPILWANMHLLFWLSLVPFATAWMGQRDFVGLPTQVYGLILLCAAIAYYILQNTIIVHQGADSQLKRAVGKDWKGRTSIAMYALAVAVAGFAPSVSLFIYGAVAVIWAVPDRRIERMYETSRSAPTQPRDPRGVTQKEESK